MATRYSRYLTVVQIMGDLVVLNLALMLGFLWKIGHLANPFAEFVVFFNFAWLAIIFIFKPYKVSRLTRIAKILRQFFSYLILHFLLTTAFYVFMRQGAYSRELLVIVYSFASGLGFFWKIAFVYFLRNYRRQGFNYRNIVILGWSPISEELGNFFANHPEYGYKLLGYFDQESAAPNVLGNLEALKEFAVRHNVSEIYCCLPAVGNKDLKDLVDFGEEKLIQVKLVTDLSGVTYRGLELETYGDFPVIKVSHSPLDDWKNRAIKRGFDILFSLIMISVFMWWMVPLIALLVKITSRGPVFFKQMRTGEGNRVFTCYKFRSMHINSDADTLQASRNDPRITKLGAILRKTSLDELPQFLNVLLGQMSVVGPRPHMLKHTEEYSKIIGRYMARHAIKPGITGLAQVKGLRGETTSVKMMESRVRFDLFYVEKWSLLFDIQIILETVRHLLSFDQNNY